MDWWSSFSGLEQSLAAVGIFALVVFIIQTALALFGVLEVDGDMDLEADVDTESKGGSFFFELFTVRNLLAFLTGLSWTTLGLLKMGVWAAIAFPVGFMVGSFLVWLNGLVLAGIGLLNSKGNIDISKAVGRTGQMSLGISGDAGDLGKVTFAISGRRVELLARSSGGTPIRRHSWVRIVELRGDTAVVEPLGNS